MPSSSLPSSIFSPFRSRNLRCQSGHVACCIRLVNVRTGCISISDKGLTALSVWPPELLLAPTLTPLTLEYHSDSKFSLNIEWAEPGRLDIDSIVPMIVKGPGDNDVLIFHFRHPYYVPGYNYLLVMVYKCQDGYQPGYMGCEELEDYIGNPLILWNYLATLNFLEKSQFVPI